MENVAGFVCRPVGTRFILKLEPTVKTVGYFRPSLCDKNFVEVKSDRLLLSQAMERAGAEHQINRVNTNDRSVFE